MKPRSIASSALLMFVIAKGMQKGFILRRPCSRIREISQVCAEWPVGALIHRGLCFGADPAAGSSSCNQQHAGSCRWNLVHAGKPAVPNFALGQHYICCCRQHLVKHTANMSCMYACCRLRERQ